MSARFSLKAHPAFARYMFGQGASIVGNMMRELTIAWLVLELTGSPTWLAAVSLARLGAMLALLLPAGTLVDRLLRRRVILIAESGSLLVSLSLAGLSAAGVLSPWLLVLAALLLGGLHAFEAPARSVLVHDLVPSDHLLPALSLMSAAQGAARIVGPALGGLLLSRIGAISCFIIDATSYVVLLVVVVSLPGKEVAAGGEGQGSTLGAVFRQLGAANASLQLAVPETMRARTVSLYTIIVHAYPVGGWLLALGASLWDLRVALLALAALCSALVLAAPIVSRSFNSTVNSAVDP